MFRNNYQGGAVVEIFSGQGKDPVAKWKLCGGPSAIHKEYNKEVKGFIYCLEGSSQTVKMQMPENGRMSLGLLQRFLVLQVNIPQSKDFSIELMITDSEHLKRRLHLSTVHKELSATPLHAKWCTLCIDLVSFIGNLFKGFLTLDVITLFATCKVRRIFTMKTEPTGTSHADQFLSGTGLADFIPRSCQFPPDVKHVVQVLNMENLRRDDIRDGQLSTECGPEPSATLRPTRNRRTRPRGISHTDSGSRDSGPPSQTGRLKGATSCAMNKSELVISNTEFMSSEMNQRVRAESQSIVNLNENLSHGEPSQILLKGTPGTLQPHPPKDRVFDKLGSKKLRVYGAGRERQASSDAVPSGHRKRSIIRENGPPPSSTQESWQQPLTLTERMQRLTADERRCSPATESSGASPTAALSGSSRPGLSCDLQVCSSRESNEGYEPQLILQEEVFTFLSPPHSPKRGQGQGDQEKMEMGNDQVQCKNERRYEAQPEDDFIGSESDEDKSYSEFQHQRSSVGSNPATPRSPNQTLDVQIEARPDSHNNQTTPKELIPVSTSLPSPSSGSIGPAGIIPTRCLSPSATLSRLEHKCSPCGSGAVNRFVNGNSSVSLSRRLLQEVRLDDFTQHKEEEDNTLKPGNFSCYSPHLLNGLQMHGDDDEELQMLASLKREHEQDECRASDLSASQIHQCNVSISVSSDDTSTWTHISTIQPANQGHHYQKEMNPLLQSNPREWMDVLSPPIMPPSQQGRSDNTWNVRENPLGGGDESVNEEENEDEYLNLLYDPCLNCYFDPKTGKYYELA